MIIFWYFLFLGVVDLHRFILTVYYKVCRFPILFLLCRMNGSVHK